MSGGQKKTDEGHLLDRWRLILSGFGAIGTFVGVIQYSQRLKLMIGGTILAIWVVFELLLLCRSKVIPLLFKGASEKEATRKGYVPTTRWMFSGILTAILLAAGYKAIDEHFTPPPEPVSRSVYSMIVLDATEKMNQKFEGSTSKWEAVQTTFQDYFMRANRFSNYGMIVIGGGNPQEKETQACDIPSVPLIPLVHDDGDGTITLAKDLSLENLQNGFRSQQPNGEGSLSLAFFRAKDQLENLPVARDSIRIIVLVTSASDDCKGEIDWDGLINDIQLVSKVISIHKELILLDENIPPRLEEIAEGPTGDPDLYIQLAQNYEELTKAFFRLAERLEAHYATTTSTPGSMDEQGIAASPASGDTDGNEPGSNPRSKTTATSGLIPAVRTLTCTPTTTTVTATNTTAPLASTEEERIPASTITFTSTTTFTPTATGTETITPYPTVKPTKKIVTVTPAPTNTPVPPPTTDPCCMHCTVNSQPCGGACIPLTSVCHVGPGCACKP